MSSKIVNKSIKTHEKKDNKNEITNDINRKKLNVTNTLLIIIFSLTVSLIISMITIPYIQFKNKDIEINYNTEFNNNDYTAKNLFKNYTKEVIVKDNINNKKIGTYEIEYKLKFGLINIIKKRKVKVIDNIKPDIKLKGNNVEYVCPNKEYIELGYSATDEYDGDLTNKVEIKNYKDNITYSFKKGISTLIKIVNEYIFNNLK